MYIHFLLSILRVHRKIVFDNVNNPKYISKIQVQKDYNGLT